MRKLSTQRIQTEEISQMLNESGAKQVFETVYENWLKRHTELVDNVAEFRGRLHRVGLHGTSKWGCEKITSGDFEVFTGDVTYAHADIEDPAIATGLLHGMISKATFFATNGGAAQFGGIFVLKYAPDTLPTMLGGTNNYYPRRMWTSELLSDNDELRESLGFNDRGKPRKDLNSDYMHRRMRFRMSKEDFDRHNVGLITESNDQNLQPSTDLGVKLIANRLDIQSMVLELLNVLEAKFPDET